MFNGDLKAEYSHRFDSLALGVYGDYGTLSAGAFADINLVDKDLNIRALILKGKKI